MNKPNKKGVQSPATPEIPGLPGIPELPELPDLDDLLDTGNLPDLESLMAEPSSDPFAHEDGVSFEDGANADAEVISEQFKAIQAGRKQQADAVALANDSEFWFAMYFQTRAQKEAFLAAMKWITHGDKYIDGLYAARKQGITLPERPAPHKVGRLDKKLMELT